MYGLVYNLTKEVIQENSNKHINSSYSKELGMHFV